MTVHVSVRSISALLLLSVSLLGLPADALAQSVVAPQKTAPTLAERVSLDAETGDVLQTQQTMWSVEGGVAVAMPVTTTYSDYREVGGMRVPHRYIESTEMGGLSIYQVERVEVGVELSPDTFTLQPSTESGRGK